MRNWPDHVTCDEMVAAMDKVGVDVEEGPILSALARRTPPVP
jgi:hypothetical protein